MSTKPMHRAVVSPRGPEQQYQSSKTLSSMRSPQTITLGNQSESIVRGMAVTGGSSSTAAMVTPSGSQPYKRFTQTAPQQQLPLLPNMLGSGEPSRPIRITRRKPVEVAPRQATQPSGEDLLSASPSELKLMYDEATWRMYHLIQTARMEKQAAAAKASSEQQQQWLSESNNCNDQFLYDDSFFQLPSRHHHQNTPPPASMGMRPAVVSPEDDLDVDYEGEECVFELDDL